MGHVILNPGSAYAKLTWSIHPSRTNEKARFKSMTPLFVCGNSNIKKTSVTLC